MHNEANGKRNIQKYRTPFHLAHSRPPSHHGLVPVEHAVEILEEGVEVRRHVVLVARGWRPARRLAEPHADGLLHVQHRRRGRPPVPVVSEGLVRPLAAPPGGMGGDHDGRVLEHRTEEGRAARSAVEPRREGARHRRFVGHEEPEVQVAGAAPVGVRPGRRGRIVIHGEGPRVHPTAEFGVGGDDPVEAPHQEIVGGGKMRAAGPGRRRGGGGGRVGDRCECRRRGGGGDGDGDRDDDRSSEGARRGGGAHSLLE